MLNKGKKKMKKIMIAIGAIAIAAYSQAASVRWNVTGVSADPAGTAYTGYKLYLCDASVYTASALAADLAAGNFDALSTSGFVQATATTVQQGTSAAAKISTLYTGGDYTAGNSYTFYTLVLNAEGDAATYFSISADVTQTAPTAGTMNMAFTNLSSGAQTAWTATTAVPEPTSGLLMLLGMAGLALRRRRA